MTTESPDVAYYFDAVERIEDSRDVLTDRVEVRYPKLLLPPAYA